MNDDIQRIKRVAASLTESENAETVAKAAELLKCVSEIENQRAETRKMEDEVQNLEKHKKINDIKEFIALLGPLITTFVLAGTLALQSYQFSRTERDKAAEAQRQADAAEDVSWGDGIKLLTSSSPLSPAAVLLKRFAKSPRYAEQARLIAVDLLLKTSDPSLFKSLFGSAFVPVEWESLPQVIETDRQLYQKANPLLVKAWDFETKTQHIERLTQDEKRQLDYLNLELDYICGTVAILLKSQRAPSQALDFHSTALWDTDLQGADLSGADITGCNLQSLNLKGANLGSITRFEGSVFAGSAWWEASQVSRPLRAYLEKNFPNDPARTYAGDRKFTDLEYTAELQRLKENSSQ